MAYLKRKRNRKESEIGKTVCEWAKLHKIPIVHIANEGKRSLREGAELKAMGLSAGFPDFLIPLMRQGYGGLFVELKPDKNARVSKAQKEWIAALNENGYFATVTRGFEESIDIIGRYAKGEL